MEWREFRRYFSRKWEPGQHIVIVGQTGSGKTILEREILHIGNRSWVVLDGKRGLDPSLELGEEWKTIRTWESPYQRAGRFGEWIRELWSGEQPKPVKLKLVGPKMKNDRDFAKLRPEFARALAHARWHQKNGRPLNICVDEMQIVAAPAREGGLNLGTQWIAPLLREIRYTGASVLTSTQFPHWIPKSAARESTHKFFFRPHDEESADAIGKMAGNRRIVLPMLDSLKRHEFLYTDSATGSYRVSKVELPK
jgi:hypothetical protein